MNLSLKYWYILLVSILLLNAQKPLLAQYWKKQKSTKIIKKRKKKKSPPAYYDKLEDISNIKFDTSLVPRKNQKIVVSLYVDFLEKRALAKCKSEIIKHIHHPKPKYRYKSKTEIVAMLSERLSKTFGKSAGYFEHKLKKFLNKRNVLILHNQEKQVDSAIAKAIAKGHKKLILKMKLLKKMSLNGTISQYLPSTLVFSPAYEEKAEVELITAKYNDLVNNRLNYHRYVLTKLNSLQDDSEVKRIKASLIEDIVDFTTYEKHEDFTKFDRFYKNAILAWRDLDPEKLKYEIDISRQSVAILEQKAEKMLRDIKTGSLQLDPKKEEKLAHRQILPYEEFRTYRAHYHPKQLEGWLEDMNNRVWDQEDGKYGVFSAKSSSKSQAKDRAYSMTRTMLKRKKIASIDDVKLYSFMYKTRRGYKSYYVFQYPREKF